MDDKLIARLLSNFFRNHSLEEVGVFLSHYPAIVGEVGNGDDVPFYKIKVVCPQLYHKENMFGKWISPIAVWGGNGIGLYAMPNKGDRVYIVCKGGDPNYPNWLYGGWADSQIPKVSDAKNMVLQSTNGIRIEIDDKNEIIKLTNDTTYLEVYKDGIKFGNDGNTFKKFVTDLLNALLTAKVATSLGPQAFLNLPQFNSIKSVINQWLK